MERGLKWFANDSEGCRHASRTRATPTNDGFSWSKSCGGDRNRPTPFIRLLGIGFEEEYEEGEWNLYAASIAVSNL